jgi:hypothetical protein
MKTGSQRSTTFNQRALRRLNRRMTDDSVEWAAALNARDRAKKRCDYLDSKAPFCPWVGCRFHLYLDIQTNGAIKVNHGDLEVWEIPETCALAATCADGMNKQEIGELLNLTRERVRQIEAEALERIRERMGESR